MKFSELNEQQWEEHGIYFDTCILPITGLTGTENPVDCVTKLTDLQTRIDAIEKNFRGRVVIYPAYHYISETLKDALASVIRNLKSSGFKYIVILAVHLDDENIMECGADLYISNIELSGLEHAVKDSLLQLWK
jgi:hypothetical protein